MRPIRRHGTQAPQDDISSTRRRVLADCECAACSAGLLIEFGCMTREPFGA